MADVKTLHSATAYNDTPNLAGKTLDIGNAPVVLVWFVPAASYDGTANLEISPDDGATWFAVDGRALSALETYTNAIASPAATAAYVVSVPADCLFRVRLSGGTQGTLTVKAARTFYTSF